MIPVYFDIDGVLRLLDAAVFGREQEQWVGDVEGKSFMEYIGQHRNLLASAPPSIYVAVVQEWYTFLGTTDVLLLTAQQDSWKEHTEMWLSRYFYGADMVCVEHPEEKVAFLEEERAFVVDDLPFFSSYTNVALVTRGYNKDVSSPVRIASLRDLRHFLAFSYVFDYMDAGTAAEVMFAVRFGLSKFYTEESFEQLVAFYQNYRDTVYCR